MGLRYVLFRITFQIKTTLGLQKKIFPINPKFRQHITLQDWKKELPKFFFSGKNIKGLKRKPTKDLKVNLKNLKRGFYTFFNNAF